MKRIFYVALWNLIIFAALFVGMVKGKEERNRWVAKMKNRQEERNSIKAPVELKEIALDDFELATYHS